MRNPQNAHFLPYNVQQTIDKTDVNDRFVEPDGCPGNHEIFSKGFQ